MSDWKSIVGNFAPSLGAALGGPLGGAAGLAVKAALNLGQDASDNDIAVALQSPEAAIKLKQAEYDFKIKMGEQAIAQSAQENDIVREVNTTMRAELTSEHWLQWAWRPLWGVISAVTFGFVCVLASLLAYKAVVEHDNSALAMIPQFISAMTLLFGVPGAILGITAWGRNQLKLKQVGS
jgi:Holin of 3TMs, for gene-transfer release